MTDQEVSDHIAEVKLRGMAARQTVYQKAQLALTRRSLGEIPELSRRRWKGAKRDSLRSGEGEPSSESVASFACFRGLFRGRQDEKSKRDHPARQPAPEQTAPPLPGGLFAPSDWQPSNTGAGSAAFAQDSLVRDSQNSLPQRPSSRPPASVDGASQGSAQPRTSRRFLMGCADSVPVPLSSTAGAVRREDRAQELPIQIGGGDSMGPLGRPFGGPLTSPVRLVFEGSSIQLEMTRAINSATKSIRVASYCFDSYELSDKLVHATNRQVSVTLLVDEKQLRERRKMADIVKVLSDWGVKVYRWKPLDSGTAQYDGCMHIKGISVDSLMLLAGSANHTSAAVEKNCEMAMKVQDLSAVQDFDVRFDYLVQHQSEPVRIPRAAQG